MAPIKTYTRTAYEIFEEIEALKTKKERVDAIKKINKNQMITNLLVCAFNDYLKASCVLPDTPPPYTASSEESHPSHLIREYKKLDMFYARSDRPAVSQVRLEKIYIGILEGIHPKDAELVSKIMVDDWPYTKITKAVVKEARPGLFRKPSWKPRT